MRSKQRVGIKKVIEDLGRHALEIQAYRGTLIHRICANPSYKHKNYDDEHATTPSKAGVSNKSEFPSRPTSELDPTLIDMIQKVLVAESSLSRIRTKSAQLNALIAPVHTLPDEILRLIFEEVVRTPRSDVLVCPTSRNIPAPLVLAAVSQRWRTVALGCPRLWTNIRLSPSQRTFWSQLAFERSGTHNVRITLAFCDVAAPTPDVLDRLLAIALPHVDRWEEFAVVSHHCFTLAHVSRTLSDLRAPALKTLRLSLTGKGPLGDQSVLVPHLFQGGTPSLSRVHLYSVGLDWDSSTLLKHLTYLDLRWLWGNTKLSYAQFRDIISACPELQKLVLRGLYVGFRASDTACPKLRIPSLRYFEISGDSVSRMCATLCMPNLEALHLANVDEAEFRELMQLCERPEKCEMPNLRSFSMLNVRTAQPSPGFFELLRELDELTIIHSDAARWLHLLKAQQGTDEGGASFMLPRLKTLTLLDDTSDEMLLAVVADRAELGRPLQRVNVHAGSVNVLNRQLLEHFVKLDGVYYREASC